MGAVAQSGRAWGFTPPMSQVQILASLRSINSFQMADRLLNELLILITERPDRDYSRESHGAAGSGHLKRVNTRRIVEAWTQTKVPGLPGA